MSIDAISVTYVLSSAVAAIASLSGRTRRSAGTWMALSLGVLALGLLRRMEIAVYLGGQFRFILRSAHLYGAHQLIQVGFIAGFLIVLLSLFMRARSVTDSRFTLVAISAYLLLTALSALRALSLHWSDALLGRPLGGLTASHALQLLLLFVATATAFCEIRRSQYSNWGRVALRPNAHS